ncbi:hypothetical protein MNEG_11226 [Monoraphidium neglectum]|uniref:Uncharacterized protein n=1 Tax=Monoraphidium neglectum TaxID=145388 RepID=A0A0D2LZC2_9CHLO|nr:hypothetical protein MNEG_11226 [Monoraphidium neglectum]KIY96734.1 hypothetical protein MNEG_11226 [Monoraphidium neglectum]|eukprot:XP_013895754.1 hypothetical protein MNEG_11226 [Monoraphidium neglectum]
MGINGYLVLVAALCCTGLALGAQIKDPTKHMSPQQRVVRSIPKLEDGEAPFVAVTRSGRLVERPIGELPGYTPPTPRCGANGVPIVDPPKRVAGYFKLNRTADAHMFYFYYQSRSRSREDDPVILWMTGARGG